MDLLIKPEGWQLLLYHNKHRQYITITVDTVNLAMSYGPAGDIDIPNSSIDNRDIIVLNGYWKRVKLTAHYLLFSEINIMLHLLKVGKNKNIKNI